MNSLYICQFQHLCTYVCFQKIIENFGTFKICFLYVQKEGTHPFVLNTERPLRDSWLLRNGQNCSVHQILEIRFIEVSLHVFLAFQRCNKQKRGQLKLMSTKSIPNYVLCQVISKFFLMIVNHRKLWNLQDLLSICLQRGDTPVRFAYKMASEGSMVAEKWAEQFCTSSFRNKVH